MEDQNIHISQVVLYIVFLSIVFLIGMSLQIKIIKSARKEKPVTWRTEIFHSIIMIIHFTLIVFFQCLVYMIPDYTVGWWMCMSFRYIRRFGIAMISSHSIIISVHKYIVIVNRIDDNSERQKLETVLMVLYSTFIILWTAAILIRNFSSIPIFFTSENCLAIGKNYWETFGQHNDENSDTSQGSQSSSFAGFCKFGSNNGNYNEDNIIFFMTELYCFAQTCFTVMIGFNIFEGLVYYKIFRFINR